jgi:hypothetical protein
MEIKGAGLVALGPVVDHHWSPAKLDLACGAMPSSPGAFLARVPTGSLSCDSSHPLRGQKPTTQLRIDKALSRIMAPLRMTTLGTSPGNGCQVWKTSVKMNQLRVIEHKKILNVEMRATLRSPNEFHKS